MPKYSLSEAIELRLKNFATYALSLCAAMLIYKGIDEVVTKYNKGRIWVIWMAAFLFVVFAIGILSLITWADPNDIEEPS